MKLLGKRNWLRCNLPLLAMFGSIAIPQITQVANLWKLLDNIKTELCNLNQMNVN
jgi:hypothetical protein